MKKYEINKNTAAIVGLDEENSKVIEENKEYHIEDRSYSVMEHSCRYFGCTYQGRLIGSKCILGSKYKVPIIVEESNNIIFFPTTDIENPQCMWISLKWFDRVEEDKDGNTYIYLKNGKRISTSISKNSIENQALKSIKLDFLISSRKKC